MAMSALAIPSEVARGQRRAPPPDAREAIAAAGPIVSAPTPAQLPEHGSEASAPAESSKYPVHTHTHLATPERTIVTSTPLDMARPGSAGQHRARAVTEALVAGVPALAPVPATQRHAPPPHARAVATPTPGSERGAAPRATVPFRSMYTAVATADHGSEPSTPATSSHAIPHAHSPVAPPESTTGASAPQDGPAPRAIAAPLNMPSRGSASLPQPRAPGVRAPAATKAFVVGAPAQPPLPATRGHAPPPHARSTVAAASPSSELEASDRRAPLSPGSVARPVRAPLGEPARIVGVRVPPSTPLNALPTSSNPSPRQYTPVAPPGNTSGSSAPPGVAARQDSPHALGVYSAVSTPAAGHVTSLQDRALA
jgi:hypothetical protein